MKIFETDFRDFVYFSSYKQHSAWNMAAYFHCQKRRQNGPMICVWIHGHQLSIKFFNVPVHISKLEFIFEANFCVYTEIVCLWKFLKRTFKIFLTVFSSYKHHRAIYVVAYFRCQNGIYNCNKSVNTNCLLMKIFETDFRDFVYFSSYKQQSAWNMAAYFHCQKRRQNGPMICVWIHGHQLSIKFFNVPVHISKLEFIFEANFCVYTEIVCLWKFLKWTFKIFLTVFSSYKHHRAKDIALSKHTEQILVLLPKEITQKLHDIVVT